MIQLRKEWAAVVHAAAKEDHAKFTTGGILLIEGEDCQQAVATDGRMLALVTEQGRAETVAELADEEDLNVNRVVVAGKDLARHLKGISGKKGDKPWADAVLTGDGLMLLVNGVKVKLPQLEGRFPDVQRVIPRRLPFQVCFGIDVMRRALDVIAGFCDGETQRVVLRMDASGKNPMVLCYDNGRYDVQVLVVPLG